MASSTEATRADRTAKERATVRASGRVGQWRGIDFVTLAVLGVAFGVAFWAWDVTLYPIISAALVFPPLGSLTLGVWLIPAVVGALVVRRPGAALYTEVIAASVEMFLGNQWGAGVMVSAGLQALGVEIAVALFAWRRFGLFVAMLAGLLAAVLEITAYEWWFYMPEFDWAWRFIALGAAVTSGIVVAGIGGWLIVHALAATGVIDGFPPGIERLTRDSGRA
ncbi:MAG: ECF transporter S component [Dermatophilus congolensis]|nr:ECF transporter S component [Dermatophilus congolensis]